MSEPLLDIHDLTIAYGDILAVRNVHLHLRRDELVVVLGANGAGKSTLLSGIMGWVRPRSGTITFQGVRIDRLQPWQRSRRGISIVPEGGRLFPEMSVEENLNVVRPTKDGLALAFTLFPILRERLKQVARTLSGGERQMLALARAIATSPQLLIVDEASTGLMPLLVERLFEALAELRQSGIPVLLVEQNTQALTIADRGYVMEVGRIVREGSREALEGDPEIRRAYLGL